MADDVDVVRTRPAGDGREVAVACELELEHLVVPGAGQRAVPGVGCRVERTEQYVVGSDLVAAGADPLQPHGGGLAVLLLRQHAVPASGHQFLLIRLDPRCDPGGDGGERADQLKQESGAEAVGNIPAQRLTPQRHLDLAGPQLPLNLWVFVRLGPNARPANPRVGSPTRSIRRRRAVAPR